MSVVAGCLLTDGVLIAADTRITYLSSGGSEIYVDNAIKILLFAPGTAIGYVGDVAAASLLIQYMIHGRDRKRRTDPITLTNWIPRLLRAAYRRLKPELKKDVRFMVASSIRDRPMIIETAKVGEILFDAVRNGLHGIGGTPPLDILGCSAPFVLLSNTFRSLLYTLRSPDFEPQYVPPLNYKAIGSGWGVVEDVQRVHAQILFDNPGNLGLAFWFRNAISGFVERNNIESVGGLYPVIRVRGDEFQCVEQRTRTHKRGSAEVEAMSHSPSRTGAGCNATSAMGRKSSWNCLGTF